MNFLTGLSAFPITPAEPGGQVDTVALRKLIARLVAARVDTIGLLGSTGTYAFLTREERRRAVDAALAEADGRTPIIVGVGALRTDEAVKLATDARAAGAVAGLLAPVSYTPLTEDEVYEHFITVAGESGLPIVIYDNPGTTHFRFSPELVARLAKVPGIIGVKNPTESPEKAAAHYPQQRALVPADFSIGYSADWNCTEALLAGAQTWYAVLGGVFPETCLRIVRAAQAGDTAEARRLDAALAPVWGLLKQYSGVRASYALLNLLGLCDRQPPRPVLPLPEQAMRQAAEVLAALPAELKR
jgi:4-hydroxy-tetrahydrodipicolinate synthase